MPRFNGYIPALENRKALKALSIDDSWMKLVGSVTEPKEYDAETWFNIRNQGPVGSCRGHSGAAVIEAVYRNAVGEIDLDGDGIENEAGIDDRFSPAWMYYQTQKHDGIRGDRGSTMAGGVKTVTQDGVCPEYVYPYEPRYNPRIPQEAYEAATKYKIQNTWIAARPEDEEGIWAWIQNGVGWFDMGTVWPLAFETVGSTRFVYNGKRLGKGGGHATAGISVVYRENLWMYKIANSHGKNAQNNGWYYVTRQGMRALLGHPYTAVPCYSDLTNIRKRKFDWNNGRILL